MVRKSKNYYPRLPDAVLNLLALHGLRATAVRREYLTIPGRRARRSYKFEISLDKPGAVKTLFTCYDTNCSLEIWIDAIARYGEDKSDDCTSM